MTQRVEAVYERGAFRPLQPLGEQLEEGAHVLLVVDTARARAEKVIARAVEVYEGLSAEEVAEVEKVALDRARWHVARERE